MKLEVSPDARRNPGFRTTIRAAQEAACGHFRRFVTLAAPPVAARPAAFPQRTARDVAHVKILERFE
ncbi:hypothetical protein [Pelagibius sp.]|uniref:hypothetical protein n=1 Tax=Pelagibius sp. TaxID=1931238 RepID=UPI00260B1CD8|nr:hypothetical protein [Pelagibius sp.]